MSMDYPDYLEIRKKNRWLSLLWMTGDLLYYVGLLGTIFTVIAAPLMAIFSSAKGSQVGIDLFNVGGLALLLICIVLFFAGGYLKAYAVSRSGIREIAGQ